METGGETEEGQGPEKEGEAKREGAPPRLALAADWNGLVRAGRRITIRRFAARHGLSPETWRREYHRGATGTAVPDPRDRRRRRYAEYDPFEAQDGVNEGSANKGAKMAVTNRMARLFRRHVIDERLSPYDAMRRMEREMPGRRIPRLSTWYRHIEAGDVGVRHRMIHGTVRSFTAHCSS
ncbi:MAG: hypothetical protein ACI4RA_06820 [Kiritimatiellia bacterium]